MTDTNKDFEKWALSDEGAYHESELRKLPKGDYALPATRIASESWKACQQINDKRIADLLAVIESKNKLIDAYIENNLDLAEGEDCLLKPIIEALAITPESVELVEVKVEDHICAVITDAGGYTKYNGPTVYTIKQKG